MPTPAARRGRRARIPHRAPNAQPEDHPARRADQPHPARRAEQPHIAALPLLRLIWLASPALPVGGFSYSEGLEAAVEAGDIRHEADATRHLLQQMALVQQRGEWPLMASAARAWQRADGARIVELNGWSTTTRETQELRGQSAQMGRSLTDWLAQRWPDDARVPALAALQPAPTWPLACALAAVLSGAPLREALLAIGFGWCEAMVQAAIKAVPLGQAGGQRVLQALVDALPAAVDDALARSAQGDAARLNFAPMLAIRSAQHEAQYSRLFRS